MMMNPDFRCEVVVLPSRCRSLCAPYSLGALQKRSALQDRRTRRSEDGYTLVALLAIMTILALLAMAAAPSINQQVQRDREAEAIFRGEEVADAIRVFYNSHGQQGLQSLPTSMDQLLEGVPLRGSTKKIQILRPEAAHDPLSRSGEWRLVRPRTQELIGFERAVVLYAGNPLAAPSDRGMALLQSLSVPQITSILNTGSGTDDATTQVEADAPSATGPFVGVASRSTSGSVLTYYGLDHHNTWIFTPLFR
jgi:type II secretory pathway pseudopilin PulG